MTALRKIDGQAYDDPRAPLPPLNAGDKPQLRWIAVDCLRVDTTYQRDLGRRGIANVQKIAREFAWAKFGTVLVSEGAELGIFPIFDGQHRTTAAHLRGIKDVPCQIVKLTRAQQAAAFAAVNGNVTALTPMHLYHARVAAEDEEAVALAAVLDDAGVTVSRYPLAAKHLKPGETQAAGKLPQMMRRFGADVLRSALRCVTQTRKGNAGLLRAPIIDALCVTLDGEPGWRSDEDKLIRAMNAFDFAAAFTEARRQNLDGGGTVTEAFIAAVSGHLEQRLGTG